MRQSDVAFARQVAMKAMTAIGASAIKKTKFVTAVSEIARNAVIYGHGGAITFRVVGIGLHRSVVGECTDRGPGIADMQLALKDGYTTGSGLGLGLSGARRLVDRFDIISSAESGTTVTLESAAR
ncbi:ATP-binding protein [Mangrovicella endophytica]|uniref:ATP-binding protein n=1 Tax=Mangrovicella endophytica TaxID=2066697 RepID=UPI0018E41B22|nr:ATP-binding protein [Mangrovicella endophytica]